MDLLWQSTEQDKANASYRQAVRQIRILIEQTSGLFVETRPGLISARVPDRWSLENELTNVISKKQWSDSVTDTIRQYLSLIETLSGISNSFDSWLAIVNSRVTSLIRTSLDERIETEPETANTRAIAEFAIELEPANEFAVRHLMRMYWELQTPTRAIELYNELYYYLDENFDHEPEPETVSLLAAIKLDPSGTQSAFAKPWKHEQITISVISDEVFGPGNRDASLLSVLESEFRMRLSRFREWTVLDSNSELMPLITVRFGLVRTDNRSDLLVEVIRNPQKVLVWSEIVSEPTRNWELKLRPMLVNIANALAVVVSDRTQVDTSVAVYDRWLKSQILLDQWSPDTEYEALSILRSITVEAPRFGPAHAELAGALNVRHILLPGTRQTEDVKQNALHHALEAVSIDPLDTRAHRVLAWCYCHKSEFDLAEFHFDQALALNRQNSLTLASCALGFAFSNNLDRAAELVRECKQHSNSLEPFHMVYLAATDYLWGDYEQAAEQCDLSVGLMATVGGWHTAALYKLGRYEKARARLEQYVEEVVEQWCGDEAPDTQAVLDWFTSVFPLRDETIRLDLKTTLGEVKQNRRVHPKA